MLAAGSRCRRATISAEANMQPRHATTVTDATCRVCVCVCLWRCGSFGWLYVCASECTQCLPLHVGMGLRSCRGQGHIMRVRASARSCESQVHSRARSPSSSCIVHRDPGLSIDVFILTKKTGQQNKQTLTKQPKTKTNHTRHSHARPCSHRVLMASRLPPCGTALSLPLFRS